MNKPTGTQRAAEDAIRAVKGYVSHDMTQAVFANGALQVDTVVRNASGRLVTISLAVYSVGGVVVAE